MAEDNQFPVGVRIERVEQTEYSWGDYESCAERVLSAVDRLSKFKSPEAQGYARLWNKLISGEYRDFQGLFVSEYTDPQVRQQEPYKRTVMAVAFLKTEDVYVLANVRNINKVPDDYLLFTLAEEASHIRDFMKIANTEGKLRPFTKDEERDSEIRARIRQLELYIELKKEGVYSEEMEQLKRVVRSRSDQEKDQYNRILEHLREVGYSF